jgi:CHAT domain-containing protein
LRSGGNHQSASDQKAPKKVDIDQLMDVFDDETVLLEYHSTEDIFYIILLSKTAKQVFRVVKTEELTQHIDRYLEHLSGDKPSSDLMAMYIGFGRSAHYLYEQLLAPAIDMIQSDLPDIKRVVIIPDDVLSYLPFDCLVTQPADTTMINYRDLRYIGSTFTISYAYSLNILHKNRQIRVQSGKPSILALAYSAMEHPVDHSTRLGKEADLYYSADELKSIEQWFDGGRFIHGHDATETVFKKLAPDYALLHLAVHGLGDLEDHFNSRLEFRNSADSPDDGRLYAYELYGMDLSRTRLAVLSACESGIGKQYSGEGVFSMARGFAMAGCPSVVISLWKVNDRAASQLMGHYYKFLSEGLPVDASLKLAKMAYLDNADEFLSNPAHWAAFITLGNFDPVYTKNRLEAQFIIYVFLICTLCLSVLLYILNRRRKTAIEQHEQ